MFESVLNDELYNFISGTFNNCKIIANDVVKIDSYFIIIPLEIHRSEKKEFIDSEINESIIQSKV